MDTNLYTAEGGQSASQSRADLNVPDPSVEDALKAIANNEVAFGIDKKPADCTCQYPQVRVRNCVGHPKECRAYERIAREMGVIK